MKISSKLPAVTASIFSVMSALSRKHEAINLAQGFPNYDCPEQLKELVNKHMQAGKNQYVPMAGIPKLRERISQKVNTAYGCSINPDTDVTVTAGATQAIFSAITAFVHPGDEVILIEPAYDCYQPAIQVSGGIPVSYELTGPDYRINWEELGQLVSPKTRMIIVNNPHNPLGKIWSSTDIKALEQLTTGTDIIVLSDEVYEHLVYDGRPHQSILASELLAQRSLAIFSFGKTFHNTGWKMGYCIAPQQLMQEFQKVHQYNVFSVNSFVQYGIADFLDEPDHYLSLPQFYQSKRDFFAEVMRGSRLKPLSSEGTYFQLFDYSDISNESDIDFAKRITIEHGLATIPVSGFYNSGKDEKKVRICFAKTEELLEKAGEVLRKI